MGNPKWYAWKIMVDDKGAKNIWCCGSCQKKCTMVLPISDDPVGCKGGV